MLNGETAVIPDISADRVPHELYAGTFVRALAIAPVNVENPVVAIGALLVAALHSRRMGSGDA